MCILNSLLSSLFPLNRLEKLLRTFPAAPNSAAGDEHVYGGAGGPHGWTHLSLLLAASNPNLTPEAVPVILRQWGKEQRTHGDPSLDINNCKPVLATAHHQTSGMRKIIPKPSVVTCPITSKQKHSYLTQAVLSFHLTLKQFIFS